MSDEKPTFGLSVAVKDVDASISFYRALGVPIPDDANWRSHHVGIPIDGSSLDLDSLELTKGYDDKWNGTGVIVIMRVPTRESVDETYKRVVGAGHIGHLEPTDEFWGARYAVVLDPDGNHVGIMSPTDESLGGKPPVRVTQCVLRPHSPL
jgi:catechol 2,3-dioxygenase-like lactoylglutathione lyase family enzyme